MEEETKEKFLFHDTVISWACIIWAIASIALIIYFSGLNQVTFTIMTIGQLFVIMGIIAICKKQSTGIIFTIAGIASIVIPALNEWGKLFNKNLPYNNFLPVLLSTAVTVIGFAMMFGNGILEKISEKKCKKVVEAECVDFLDTKLNDETTVYAPVYMYTFNGKNYVKCRERYSKMQTPNIGEKVNLRINEKNPDEVYFEASKASKMLIYIFGFSFFLAGIGMLITTISEI